MRQLFNGLNIGDLPAGRVETGTIPGRTGTLAVQGAI
jgi:hypothetical protein